MRKMQPTSWFWIVAAAVLAVALFTAHNAYGQSAGARASIEGRLAMADIEPTAGGPAVPRDSGVDRSVGGGALPRDPGMDRPANGGLQPQRDRNSGDVVKRDRGQDAGDSTKAAGKAKRAGKRSVERARRGVSGVDS